MREYIRHIYLLGIFGFFPLLWGNELQDIQVQEKEDVLEISIDFNALPTYSRHYIGTSSAGPARYYVDIEPALLKADIKDLNAPKNSGIRNIRVAQNSPTRVRLVMELDDHLKQTDFTDFVTSQTLHIRLSSASKNAVTPAAESAVQPPVPAPNQDLKNESSEEDSESPLSIDASGKILGKNTPKKRPKVDLSRPSRKASQKKRIIIDPGHGGVQPGSIGPYFGTREKDIALQIAKRLESILKKDRAYETFLTRDHDRTLGLNDRTEFANKLEGHLFVSIHCNASTNRSASGVSTYFLHNADDQESLRVALRENGELALPQVSQQNSSDDYYFEVMKASMLKNFHTVQSTDLARFVQSNLMKELGRKYTQVKDRGVKSAGLYVLTGAKMPAILVETSFITHREEEKRLQNAAYQYSVALAVYRGIQNYFKASEKSPHVAVYTN